jgi:hypothetical protein
MKKTALVLLSVLVTGCNQYQLVEGGQQKVGAFSVTATPIWNKVPSSHAPAGLPTWTVDGLPLNSLMFISDIEDGKPLVRTDGEDKYPSFHATMLPNELTELVQATCAKLFQATITETGELTPLTIADQPGFEVTFEFVGQDDVIRRALVGGTLKDQKLNVMVYQAARMHYFAKDFESARQMIVGANLP